MLGSLPQAASPLLCCCVSRALSSPEKRELHKTRAREGLTQIHILDLNSSTVSAHTLAPHKLSAPSLCLQLLLYNLDFFFFHANVDVGSVGVSSAHLVNCKLCNI